ncbi:DUF805 domain-containing protein [Roseibacillus persicicus]|uniref:DUF805 domain-containing protein n=1 Tax=Roseibacillus persicicus TaxID=454148 RepID=UPI00398B2E38
MSDNPYQAPRAELKPPDYPEPTLLQKLLSFRGRFSRSQYWLYTVGSCLLIFIMVLALDSILTEFSVRSSPVISISEDLVSWICGIALIWINLAGLSKRFHDRGKSGLMILVWLIPYIGSLWILIECGCLQGISGPNRYGPDPLRNH